MTRNVLAIIAMGAAAASFGGCRRQAPLSSSATPAVAQTPAEPPTRVIRHHGQGAEEAGLVGPQFAAEQSDDDDDGGGGGGKKGSSDGPRYKDPMVYIDGVARGSFAYNEMPASVKLYQRHDEDGGTMNRMLVCDYFKALGADCRDIKATHWYGGRGHIALITGDELRHFKKSLYFHFTRDLAGKPQMEWGNARLHTRDRSDLISNVTVYVKIKPPVFDTTAEMLKDDKGTYFDGIPYAHEDGKRGVRINIDGVLSARLKRNLLEGNVTAVNEGKTGEDPRYTLKDFLASQKILPAQIRGVDLIVRDERVVRVPVEDAEDVQFTAAKQHHGEMMFFFGKHYVPVQAVDVWAKNEPPTRAMRTVTLGVATADRGSQPQPVTTQVRGRR